MRKCKMILSAAIAAVSGGMILLSSSCDPDCEPCKEIEAGERATLSISLNPDLTKSIDVQSSVQDNAVNTIDVFIFRNTETSSADYQRLDTYKRFEGSAMGNISIETTTGPKTVCVIVNSNIETYAGVTDLTELRAMRAVLSKETLGDFSMYAERECQMDIVTSLTMYVSRLIAKVEINSIRTRFAGTPYEGMKLSNCKLFLINVHGDKLLSTGTPTAAPLILNNGALVAEDVNGTVQPGLLMDNVTENIGEDGYSTAHTFYCYSNETTAVSSSTKLVLQADLDGVTYYYPLPINQDGYGYVHKEDDSDHHGIRRNIHYSYGMVISRPGTLDPNEPLVPGTLGVELNIAEWDIVPQFVKEY